MAAKKARRTRRGAAGSRAASETYSEEERGLIDRYVAKLRVNTLKEFLTGKTDSLTGTKRTLLARIEEAVANGKTSYGELVGFLDEVEPWRAQQIYLLGKPSLDIAPFRTQASLETLLKKHGALKPLRKHLPLALPPELTISAIDHDGRRLRITAVERRDGLVRDDTYDMPKGEYETGEGEEIEYRAYVERTTRGLIAFEWDLVQNFAMLQITRLPIGDEYGAARARFAKAVSRWLDISAFPDINLPRAIKRLHEDEEAAVAAKKAPALSSHGVELEGLGGARLAAFGASSDDSVTDDTDLSNAFRTFRKVSVGRRGNYYWHLDPLGTEYAGEKAHVIVFATTRRVTFPRDDMGEETIRYVLDGIRAASV